LDNIEINNSRNNSLLTPSTSPKGFSLSTCNSLAWNGSRWVAGGEGTYKLTYSSDGITWTASANGNSIITSYCFEMAPRRVLPYVYTNSYHFEADVTGPTGSATLGDYFINTTNKNFAFCNSV
jgi:hypothetical protein